VTFEPVTVGRVDRIFNGNECRTLHNTEYAGTTHKKVDITGLRPYVEISACCGWTGSGLTINANNEANRSSQSERKSREPSQWRVLEAWRAAAKRLSVVFSRKPRPRVSTRCGGDSFFTTGDDTFDERRTRTTANGG